MDIVPQLLKDMFEYDQQKRKSMKRKIGTKKEADDEYKHLFYEFKGEVEERTRIVRFLYEHNALTETDDYYHGAFAVVSTGRFEDFVFAYKLMAEYRKRGGEEPWGFKDGFWKRHADWKMTKEEAEAEIERQIGTHPRNIDKG